MKQPKRQRQFVGVDWKFLPELPFPKPAAERSRARESVGQNALKDQLFSVNCDMPSDNSESQALRLTKGQEKELFELDQLIRIAIERKARMDAELASEASISDDEEEVDEGNILGNSKAITAASKIAQLLAGPHGVGAQDSSQAEAEAEAEAEEDLKRRQRALGLVEESEDAEVVNLTNKSKQGPPIFIVQYVNRLSLAERVPDSLLTHQQAEEQREFDARNMQALNMLRADVASGEQGVSKYGTTWYMRPEEWSVEARARRQAEQQELANQKRDEDANTVADAASATPQSGEATGQQQHHGADLSEIEKEVGSKVQKPRPPFGSGGTDANGNGSRAAVNARSKAAMQHLEAQQREALQDLYISKQYKAFVLASGESLPAYLRNMKTGSSSDGLSL